MNMGWAALVLLAALAGAYKSNWVDTRYQPIFRPPGVGSVGYTGDPNGLMFREDTKTYHAFWQCKVGEIDGKTLWCHALSKDLATWTHLPYEAAMSYSGGATQTAGGVPKMLYKDVERGNRFYTASPANLSDPRLVGWVESATPTALSAAATDPSSGWPTGDGGFYVVQGVGAGAALSRADANFSTFESMNRSLLTFDWDFNPKDPTPRDPNFFKVDATTWAFEGSQKMCFWGGHDMYTVGTYDETTAIFAPDDAMLAQTSPADFGGELWASNTFVAENGDVVTMAWVLDRAGKGRFNVASTWVFSKRYPREKHPRFEFAPRDDRSSKNEPKRVENDRDTSLQSRTFLTLFLPRRSTSATRTGASSTTTSRPTT